MSDNPNLRPAREPRPLNKSVGAAAVTCVFAGGAFGIVTMLGLLLNVSFR